MMAIQSTAKMAQGKAALAALACFAGLLLSTPAVAQSGGREIVFVDLGRWTIFEGAGSIYGRQCVLRMAPQNGVSLSYHKSGTSPAILRVQTNSAGSVMIGDIVFSFDEREFEGREAGPRSYTPVNNGSSIEAAFREARFLSVRKGGATLAQVSLQTSIAAFRLLKQCAEQGRIGLTSAEAARARSAAETRLLAAAPASRPNPPPAQTSRPTPPASRRSAPIPRNNSEWVRESDYRRFASGSWSGGVLGFTLIVNARGRAEDCVVNRSSGSREFDARTCRNLIRRARFQPAKDDSGNATTGRYSSSIRFALSD